MFVGAMYESHGTPAKHTGKPLSPPTAILMQKQLKEEQ